MRSLAIVFVRALGAFLVTTNTSVFATLLATQLTFRENSNVAVPLIVPAAAAVIGVAMVIWSRSLGALLASGMEEPAAPAIGGQQLLKVGTALLALFFLATAVSDIVAASWDYFWQEPPEREIVAGIRRQRAVAYIVNAATRATMGVGLLWMAWGLFARSTLPK